MLASCCWDRVPANPGFPSLCDGHMGLEAGTWLVDSLGVLDQQPFGKEKWWKAEQLSLAVLCILCYDRTCWVVLRGWVEDQTLMLLCSVVGMWEDVDKCWKWHVMVCLVVEPWVYRTGS